MFRLIFLAFLGIYIGTNGYISRMLAHWLGLSGIGAALWYAGFTLLAASFFLSSMLPLPARLSKMLYMVGGWYTAAYILLLIAVPLLHLLLRGKNGPLTAALLALAAILYVCIGYYNAEHIRTTRYTIESDKAAPMKIALISDLHAGEIIGAEKIGEMVEAVNRMEPDLVLMAGDLFDVAGPKAVPDLEAVGMELQKIRSRLGVYAIFGNHDAGFDHQEAYAARLMESWGMTLLEDEMVTLDGLTIIGRKDRGMARKEIHELMEQADGSSYIIMMDHQPFELAEANAGGVDLLVCGHSHGGQVFPATLITQAMYKIDYGILREDDFTAVVSSGAGTWGPRMRIGSVSEVVEITIK